MLVLGFQPEESAVLDFSAMTDEEFKELRRKGCRIQCVGISKQHGSYGNAKLGFVFPRSVRIVRSELLERAGK